MPFDFIDTELAGVKLIKPRKFKDDRGYFLELYKQSDFEGTGIIPEFRQINHSFSQAGTLRGLHFQRPPHAQAKLVCVLSGEVKDIVVDLRLVSPTYGQHLSVNLSDSNGSMLWVPEGFAHGFFAIVDSHIIYAVTSEYNKDAEGGVIWNDQVLKINWGTDSPVVSNKDSSWPGFEEARVFKDGI